MRAESRDGRRGHVPKRRQRGRRFRAIGARRRYRCGRCGNAAHGNGSGRPVDAYPGARSGAGRETDAMRAAPAEGRCVRYE